MKFEFFIALRYLFAKRKGQVMISITSIISILGVMLGVGALIVVMAVINGFTADLRDKIVGASSHLIILSVGGKTVYNQEDFDVIKNTKGVLAACPFLYSELMASSKDGVKGVIARGVDPSNVKGVFSILDHMTYGRVEDLSNKSLKFPGIIIGKELAERLNVDVGGRVNLLSPSGMQSTSGYQPKIAVFEVVGIFSVNLFEYDSSLVFISLDAAQDILNMPKNLITGIDVAVDDIYNAQEIGMEIKKELGYPYYFKSWIDMNGNLFAALKLEKIAMSIVLSLIVLVGSFSIVTSLVMLVMEKKRDIAVLMSIGAKQNSIRKIFILQGSIIGFFGTILGCLGGLGICWFLSVYKIQILPEGIYSVDYLPVLLEWQDVVVTSVGAMILCFLATIYPAMSASSIQPVVILRGE